MVQSTSDASLVNQEVKTDPVLKCEWLVRCVTSRQTDRYPAA